MSDDDHQASESERQPDPSDIGSSPGGSEDTDRARDHRAARDSAGIGEDAVRRAIADVLCLFSEHGGSVPPVTRDEAGVDELHHAAEISAALCVLEADRSAAASVTKSRRDRLARPSEDRVQRLEEARHAWAVAYLVGRRLLREREDHPPVGFPWVTACIYSAWPRARERAFERTFPASSDLAVLESIAAGRGLRRASVPFVRQLLVEQFPHVLLAIRHGLVCASR